MAKRAGHLWMRGCFVLAAIVGAACADARVSLEAPSEALGLESWVLWVEGVMVAAPAGLVRLELETLDEQAELILLGYRQTLETLGISAGPVASGVNCRPCELTRPAGTWTLHLEGGRATEGDWVLGELPAPSALRSLVPDLERCERCRPFRIMTTLADEPPDPLLRPAFVTAYERGHLVAYQDGTIRRLEISRPFPAPPVPACIPDPEFRPWVGYRATETVMWIVDSANRVYRFDLDRLDPAQSCRDAATLSSTIAWAGPPLNRLSGPKSSEPDALYGAVHQIEPPQTVLSRFDLLGRTEVLGTLVGEDNDVDLAYAGPGDVVMVSGGPNIIRLRADVPKTERVEASGVALYTSSVTHDPARGYLFGSSNTLVAIEDGMGGYRYLAPFENNAQRVISISSYQDGLIIGERNGSFRRYFDELGYCPTERGFGSQLLRHLLEGPSGEVIGGNDRLYYERPQDDGCSP